MSAPNLWRIEPQRLYNRLGESIVDYPPALQSEIFGTDATFPYSDLALVTCDSPLRYKRAVEKMGYFFRKETQFGVAGYEVVDCGNHPDTKTRAFLFLDRDHLEHPQAIGAVCFRWREWEDADHCWALQWVWIHPFARRHGRLQRVWPFFEAMFGPFYVEAPYSAAMLRFLKRRPPQMVPMPGGEMPLYGVSGGTDDTSPG